MKTLLAMAALAAPGIATANISAAECYGGHWIDHIAGDGSMILLDDGSVWIVAPADRPKASLWLTTTDEIVACNDERLINLDATKRLINTDASNQSVKATRVRRATRETTR